mmetsp:Transcript_22446/g.63267  ORF Transcript_22446/g.63267 Transcript_22446/m.63267 type:complete len:286 (+) Transcript_22446:762-1619(+)
MTSRSTSRGAFLTMSMTPCGFLMPTTRSASTPPTSGSTALSALAPAPNFFVARFRRFSVSLHSSCFRKATQSAAPKLLPRPSSRRRHSMRVVGIDDGRRRRPDAVRPSSLPTSSDVQHRGSRRSAQRPLHVSESWNFSSDDACSMMATMSSWSSRSHDPIVPVDRSCAVAVTFSFSVFTAAGAMPSSARRSTLTAPSLTSATMASSSTRRSVRATACFATATGSVGSFFAATPRRAGRFFAGAGGSPALRFGTNLSMFFCESVVVAVFLCERCVCAVALHTATAT